MISDPAKILTQVPDVEDGRPTIIYDPAHGRIRSTTMPRWRGKMMRAKVRDTACTDIETAMARYGEWAEDVITQLFPSYREGLDRKRVTYRPFPRNSTQSLHIDSSYGYPTQGRGMLRIFTNINPVNRPRIWQLGEPFEPFVGRSCLRYPLASHPGSPPFWLALASLTESRLSTTIHRSTARARHPG